MTDPIATLRVSEDFREWMLLKDDLPVGEYKLYAQPPQDERGQELSELLRARTITSGDGLPYMTIRFATLAQAYEANDAINRLSAPDALRQAVKDLLDTEMGELACTGSDAPVEDALGRLRDAASGAQPVALSTLTESELRGERTRFLNLVLDIRRVINWETPLNGFEVVQELQEYIEGLAASAPALQAGQRERRSALDDIELVEAVLKGYPRSMANADAMRAMGKLRSYVASPTHERVAPAPEPSDLLWKAHCLLENFLGDESTGWKHEGEWPAHLQKLADDCCIAYKLQKRHASQPVAAEGRLRAALEDIAAMTYDAWSNGARAGEIARAALSGSAESKDGAA